MLGAFAPMTRSWGSMREVMAVLLVAIPACTEGFVEGLFLWSLSLGYPDGVDGLAAPSGIGEGGYKLE